MACYDGGRRHPQPLFMGHRGYCEHTTASAYVTGLGDVEHLQELSFPRSQLRVTSEYVIVFCFSLMDMRYRLPRRKTS